MEKTQKEELKLLAYVFMFSLFIIHPIVIGVFNMINLNKYLEGVLIVILTIILSVISFRLFEKRLVKKMNKKEIERKARKK